jgi:hypothetical protein
MKSPAEIIGCLSILFVLFTAELCQAGIGSLASIGSNLAMADVKGPSAIPNIDDDWNASMLSNPKDSGLNKSSRRSPASNGVADMDVSDSQMGMAGSSANPGRGRETAGSSYQHYLLVVMLSGAVGLVLIAAGVVQWWQRRSIRRYWLFPAVIDDTESSSPAVAMPVQLIAKKQLEALVPDPDTKMHAQRRAA